MEKSIVTLADGAGEYGIDQLKVALRPVFQNINLDKDGDGRIEASELTNSLFNVLFPILANLKGVSNEARDLTLDEFDELFGFISNEFPLQAQLREEVELLVVAVVDAIKVNVRVYDAIRNLRAANKANLEPKEEPAE